MKKLNAEKLNALVDARVSADIACGKVGGAALCVVQDGKVLLHKTYGYQNATTKEPLKEDAMFRLASMTKPITAVAALIAEEQGLLSIDDEL
ncbi:MAG: beta-lactamase family protein, partial [Clostridia bacterium]|nr:beta-lactamase family protein [Clostridia bacterium]